ncbi:MAG: M23 family metallopeptidase, partial [Deltaproteobacteria bacterium]
QNVASIAKTYDVSIQEIIKVNRLREPVKIKEGDAIFIPGASIEKVVDAHMDDPYTPPAKAKGRPAVETPRRDVSTTTSKAEKGRFIWPLEGKLISGFGIRNGQQHKGIDIKAEEGTPVKAADSGKVIYSGNGLNGYGNLVIIKHEGTFFTVYAHNRKNMVSEGDLVGKGDLIAEVGDTGRATTPHLHFEVRKSKVTVDPIFYLP